MKLEPEAILNYQTHVENAPVDPELERYARILEIQSKLMYVAWDYAVEVLAEQNLPHSNVMLIKEYIEEYVEGDFSDVFCGYKFLLHFASDEYRVTVIVQSRDGHSISLSPNLYKTEDEIFLHFDFAAKEWGEVCDE